MTTQSDPRLALIGCGTAAVELHLPALKKLAWRPSFLIDPDVERVAPLAARHQSRAVADYMDLLDRFDVALVAAPHSLHAPICCDLLENGKDVLVEKPIAPTLGEAKRIVAAEEKSGKSLRVGFMRRYFRAPRWVKALIDSGGLGQIESFDVREGFVFSWPISTGALWSKAKAGGGVLIDTGAHTLDQIMWWMGPIAKIDSYKDDNHSGVEADCIFELTLKNGAKGVVELSRTRELRSRAIIRGEKGSVDVDLVGLGVRTDPAGLVNQTFEGLRPDNLGQQTIYECFIDQLADWRALLAGEDRTMVTSAEAVAGVQAIEDCYAIREPWTFSWSPTAGAAASGGSVEAAE